MNRVQVTLEYVGAGEMYIHKLRAILKDLGRRYSFNCVGIVELPAETNTKHPNKYKGDVLYPGELKP